MLNCRHDEEFHCSIRLKYSAQVLGVCLVTHDDETDKDVVYIQNPVEVNVIMQKDLMAKLFVEWDSLNGVLSLMRNFTS